MDELRIDELLLKLDKTELKDNGVLVLYYDKECVKPHQVQNILDSIRDKFQNQAVIALPNGIELDSVAKQELIGIRTVIDSALDFLENKYEVENE